MNMLYDFYHGLLTDKQKEYMELYYREDYSLAEIATLNNVSRQAIYDNIKRTEQVIESYEDNLKLYYKYEARSKLYDQLEERLKEIDRKSIKLIQKLKNID